MAQYDFGVIVATSKTGTALAADLNAWRTAVHSDHKGSSAPAYAIVGQTWLDDTTATAWVLKRYDGADWIVECTFNPSDNTHAVRFAKGPDIASSATLTIPTHGNSFDVTGATGPVTAINTRGVGSIVHLHFLSTPTFTHSANLVMQGAVNKLLAAGDDMLLQEYAVGQWRSIMFQAASGSAAAVSGPAVSVDNTLPRFDLTTGKIIQGSGVVVSDLNDMSAVNSLSVTTTIVAGGNITGVSDARQKHHVVQIKNALAKLLAARGVLYRLIQDGDEGPVYMGAIAQEFRKAGLSELVVEDRDGILSIAYGNGLGAVIEALREIDARLLGAGL